MNQELELSRAGTLERPLPAAIIKQRRASIVELMTTAMKRGVDYGVVPGTQKPGLFKPGAEKLCSMFGIRVETEVSELDEVDGEIRYHVRATAYDGNATVLGKATGVCSSLEKKYKWRKPVCKAEFDETPSDSRQSIWQKQYQGDPAKVDQVRQDPEEIRNTLLQMAAKRAFIPVVRMVTGASEVFTDPENPGGEDGEEAKAAARKKPQRASETAQPPPAEPEKKGAPPAQAQGAAETAAASGVTSDEPPDAFVVQEVKVLKEGKKKNGDPYTLYKITAGGLGWMTFSHTQAQLAQECKDKGVRIFLQGDKNVHGDFELTEAKATSIAA